MQTRTALKRLSKGEIDYAERVTGAGPLAQNASWLLEKHARQEQRLQTERERHEFAQSMPILEAARRKLAEMTSNQMMPDDTPIAMRFDVFNVVKQASKKLPKDTGLRMFATHMQRLWHKEPTGTITAGALSHLRDHYQTQNPRSVVGEIIDTMVPKVAFNNLPVAQLTRIASEISSQDDYNTAIIRHGLHRDDIRSVRARAFIRELVNRKAAIETEDDGAALGIAKRSRAGDISERVVNRIIREGQSDATADQDVEASDTEAEDMTAEEAGMGQNGSGMLFTAENIRAEWDAMLEYFASTGEGFPRIASDSEAVAPEGWEHTVKELKKEPKVDNPFALAWWMKGKGYHPGGDKKSEGDSMPALAPMPATAGKTAQTPYGQGWGTENLVDIVNAAMSEMQNPAVAALVNQLTSNSPDAETLLMALQKSPRVVNKLKDAVYKGMMSEEPAQQPAQQPAAEPGMAPGMMPAVASKQASDTQACFDVQVNEQQPDSVKVPDGASALTGKGKSKTKKAVALDGFAVKADHPLVDDNQDHFPCVTEMASDITLRTIASMEKAPHWWLGSLKELADTVDAAFSARAAELQKAAEIPPQFKENMKKKKDGKDEKDGNPFAKKKSHLEPSLIETQLLGGKTYEVGNFSLKVATNNGLETIELRSKRGSRQYPLAEIDNAIADFVLLAKDEKMMVPPEPFFVVREGFRMTCPACHEVNSYPMPKEASDLNCTGCSTLLPDKVIQAAFNLGVANEEATLIAFTPVAMQESFGDKFAKAAEMMGADSVGAEGPRAEAYANHPGAEKMAEVWDFLVGSGFKPLAQFYGADDMPPMDLAPPPPGGEPMEGPMGEMPGADVPDLGEPGGGIEWADHQMVQAAMMHYKAQGNNVTEAITQFTKDYGDGYDPETVMQVASQVYGIGLDQVKVGMIKAAGDLPSTKVNQQQPDYVNVEKQPLGPGALSDTMGEVPTEKPNAQVPAQSQSGTSEGDTNMSHGDDTREMIPNPGKPKAQHPATDQKGVKVPPIEGAGGGLGSGDLSDTAMSPTTKKWDSESAGAYNNQRSK